MPVVGEAGFDQEVLAGKAEVLLHRAGDLPGLAEGIVAGGPDGGAGGIRQAKRAAEVVGVDHEELGGGGVDARDQGEGFECASFCRCRHGESWAYRADVSSISSILLS